MTDRAVELVCFDIGRVLVSLCESWEEACDLAEVQTPACLGRSEDRLPLVDLARRYETGRIECDRFFASAARLAGLSQTQMRTIWRCWLRPTFDGVEAMLDRLDAAGLPYACLSNTNAEHWRLMGDAAGHCALPMERFAYRFASHLIGAAKPEEAIYAHVEQQTGVRPESIVFFDDLEQNIAAARLRGWQALRITADRHPPEQIFAHLRRLGVL